MTNPTKPVEMPWPDLLAGQRLAVSGYSRAKVADYGNARAAERDAFWQIEIDRMKRIHGAELVEFLGIDPVSITAGAALPMVPDSWRFGFVQPEGSLLRFQRMDAGPLVAWEAVARFIPAEPAAPPVDAVPGEPVNPGDDPYPAEVWILPTAKDHENLRLSAVVDGPGPHGFMNPADAKKMAVRYTIAASVASRAGSEPVALNLFKAVQKFRNEPALMRLLGLRKTEGYGALVEAWDDMNDHLAAVAPAAAAEPSELQLTDSRIDAICAPGRAARWKGDGRQYDRDTVRLVLSALPDRAGVASLVAGERSPTDFALEHAEYLAAKAERLVEAVGAFHVAQVMLEEDYDADRDSDITELNVNLEAAGEKLSEACRATLSGVNEFRKRRARASAGEAQSSAEPKTPAQAARDAFWSGTLSDRNKPA